MCKKNFYPPYIILLCIYIFFILFSLSISSLSEIFSGLQTIISTPDILITDYIELGGLGATLVNSAFTSIICLLILVKNRIKPNGSTIMALLLMTGFSFFGKNILNIWPIMIGVWLFSKYQKEPFLNYTLVTILATTLAPTVSQLSFTGHFHPIVSAALGISIGIFTGFIIPPIASHCIKSHNGYNLYNIGFAGGLVATIMMSILRGLGINFESRFIWNTGSNEFLLFFISIICIFLIIVGYIYGNDPVNDLVKINKEPGRLVADFYLRYGESIYINIGILGLCSTLFVILIGGDLNGATLSAIFTIMGFGCFGKNLRNITPIILGSLLAALINVDPINSPNLVLSILFSTCLAPIAGKFGFLYGVLAGFLHVNVVTNIGYLHGGLNLYNNGLAGGFVAMVLIPLITTFKKENI
ncbi:DUF1576 domain-containing protein [Clostridium paraputrificum]|uniref:DUF1576 domain-containing protein n=1 Tax=Clostridium paraputrificum TaxID=29363 RepID=UPI003D32FB50